MKAVIKSNIKPKFFINRMVFKVGNILMTLKKGKKLQKLKTS